MACIWWRFTLLTAKIFNSSDLVDSWVAIFLFWINRLR